MEYRKVRTSGVGELGKTVEELFKKYSENFKNNENLWLIGGTAREVFVNWRRRILSRNFQSPPKSPRDIDFVVIGAEEIEPFRGHDLQYSNSIEDYLNTRDLAINELLLRPDWLIYTKEAEMAADNQMYGMPSKYELGTFYGEPGPRTSMRSLNTALELDGEVDSSAREGLKYAKSSFEILIQLFKAFGKGVEDEFVREMGYKISPERLIFILLKKVYDFRLTAEQRKILAYAKWVVEQEDADNEFGDLSEEKTMKLEQIVRQEVRRRLEEVRRMGYGPDKFEVGNDEDLGDAYEQPALDLSDPSTHTRTRTQSWDAEVDKFKSEWNVLFKKENSIKAEIEWRLDTFRPEDAEMIERLREKLTPIQQKMSSLLDRYAGLARKNGQMPSDYWGKFNTGDDNATAGKAARLSGEPGREFGHYPMKKGAFRPTK